jgi:CRP/FNR family transcriptional regulator, cyclic AMP receptor protein
LGFARDLSAGDYGLIFFGISRGTSRGLPTKTRKRQGFEPARFLATGDDGRSLIEYRRNEVIFSQGELADAVFYVRTGKVKLVVTSKQGKQAVVAILGVDDFLGEGCLNGESVRLATARALTEVEVTRVEKAEMIRILHAEPAFAEMFMAHLLSRTSRIQEDLVDQLFNSSEKRLARALLLLANFGKDDAPQPLSKNISQATLAGIVGTTRSRVSSFLNKFRKLGFIDYNGELKVNSSLLNVVLRD